MNDSTRILYIITLPNLGGAQVHLYELISNLPRHILPYVIIGKVGWLSEQLEQKGINVYIVSSLVRHISPLEDLKACYAIKKIITKVEPDIIHCHSSKAGFAGRVVAKLCNVPSVFTAHGWAFTDGVPLVKKFIYRNVEKMMARWTQAIICVSEYDRKIAVQAMPDERSKIKTIHNGISKEYEHIERAQSVKGQLNLVMIARFSPQKAQRLLIDAVHKLNNEGMRLQLTLVGDGPQYEQEREYVKLLHTDQIVFLGARSDVDGILARQDIFVLTSNWEGFPISILEAMRAGLPVIASDVGGVKEAVEDGVTGFLIPRQDAAYLEDRLRYCYQNPESLVKMGLQGKRRLEQCFTTEIMMDKILTVYEDIMESKKYRSDF